MRISDTCLDRRHTAPESGDTVRSSGFTLLELLAVLMLFALAAGLVLPRLATLQSRFQRAADKDEIIMQVAEMGYRVMRRGYGGRLSASPANGALPPVRFTSSQDVFPRSALPLSLPAGWTLLVKQDLIYLDNGICLGGEVEAVSENDAFTLTLLAPYCQPELTP